MSVRIGIDVGGTFTHAVAMEADGSSLLASCRVPTSHAHQDGVSAGIAEALAKLLSIASLEPKDVQRVAHSTTQATNALLEGDLAPVGVVAVGQGRDGATVATQTAIGEIPLRSSVSAPVAHRYIELSEDDCAADSPLSEAGIHKVEQACVDLCAQGARALVAASAFSVDSPELECALLFVFERKGVPATATHQVSGRYGLRARTRTAVVNAAILPQMIEVAETTERAVRELGITAPVVVMRSDGGAMDIAQMARRPIATILSGPAAGVAAAVLVARLADGIFIEVGGTSTDCSCFRDGKPFLKSAKIGSHTLFLDTLDVRTIGVAGGSMIRIAPSGKLVAVGPRSAHIAGLPYSCFLDGGEIADDLKARLVAPRPGDPDDYVLVEGNDRRAWALTPSCVAASIGDLDGADGVAATRAIAAVAEFTKQEESSVVECVRELGSIPIAETVQGLIGDYGLDQSKMNLVGGGGGAQVWLPAVAKRLNLDFELVDHGAVISAIGAAMALIQETVERTLIDPSPKELARIRAEARSAAVESGAAPDSIEVRVEMDRETGRLKATAIGSHALDKEQRFLSSDQLLNRASTGLGLDVSACSLAVRTRSYFVFSARVEKIGFLRLWTSRRAPWAILDGHGRIRALAPDGVVASIGLSDFKARFESLQDEWAQFGDGGRLLPDTFVMGDAFFVDLTGVLELEQRLAICDAEFVGLDESAHVVVAIRKD